MHGEKSEQLKKYFNIISTTCRNSLNLIGEVLNVEYLEAQQMGLKYQRMDLINRIQTQLDVYGFTRNEVKKFNLSPASGAVYATVDPVRFQLILENLISNA